MIFLENCDTLCATMSGPTYREVVEFLFRSGGISAAERRLRLENYQFYQDHRNEIVKDATLKTQWIASLNHRIESGPSLNAIQAEIANKPNSDCAYIAQPLHKAADFG